MKTIVALTLLFCISPAVARVDGSDDLHISISLTEGEHSRDSNSTSTAISIDGGKLVYDKSYSGYRANNRTPVHKQIRIKADDIERLKRVIGEKKLLVSHRLERPTNGPGRYSIAAISIALGKQRASIRFSGRISRINNEPLYKSSRALIEEIQQIVEANE
jgi:hypothetical protein